MEYKIHCKVVIHYKVLLNLHNKLREYNVPQ